MANSKAIVLGSIIIEMGELVGPWLSASLEDPNTCEEMKKDVERWLELYVEAMEIANHLSLK